MGKRWTLGIALVTFLAARSVCGQFVVNFDENGNGSVQTPAAGLVPMPGVKGIDPFDPANGLQPVTYNVAAIVGGAPLAGDLLVSEPPNTQVLSDLVRFNQGLIIVYSETAESGELPDLADVGLPASRQALLQNAIETGPEGGINGVFGYVPTPNQPGAFAPLPNGVTYNFTSDAPEPASVLAMAGAVGTLLIRPRRRNI